jgi:SAM-dependent methyltransferase
VSESRGAGFEDTALSDESFAALAELEESSAWFAARNTVIELMIRRHFPQATSLLEVGCGNGFVLAGLERAFPTMRLTGSELGRSGLEYARRRLQRSELIELDVREMQFEAKFDLVCAFDVIEHIDEDELALREMRRAVAPGGGTIIAVPQHPWLWSPTDDHSGHKRRYRRRELAEKVTRAGFEPLESTSYVTTALPLMALSRLMPARDEGEFDLFAEHRKARQMNPILEPLLKLDLALIRRRVRLPAGGSLLIAARAV